MCCNFSLLMRFFNLDFLLYFSVLFLLPVYEVDTVLRVSLLLSMLCIISYLLPSSTQYFYWLKPVSQIGLFALLWSLPINLLPSSVVWIYSLALELLGPILLLLEVLFVIVLSTDLFNYLTDLAEDDDDYKTVYNGIITALSILFYAIPLYFILICLHGWLPLVILAVTLFNSFLMWMSGCGQVWEGGVTFLLSTLIFLAMLQELKLKIDVQDAIQTLSSLNPNGPLIEFIFSLWIVTSDKFQQVKTWLYYFLTPVFVASFFIRLFSVNWLILKRPAPSEDSDTEIDIIEEEESRSWLDRQPALIRTLCTIFVLTQLISGQFYELTGCGPLFRHESIKPWLPDQILISRILQIVLANLTLQHSIYRRWLEGDTRESYSDY